MCGSVLPLLEPKLDSIQSRRKTRLGLALGQQRMTLNISEQPIGIKARVALSDAILLLTKCFQQSEACLYLSMSLQV